MSTHNDEPLPARYASVIGWNGEDRTSRTTSADKQKEAERTRRRDEALLDALFDIQSSSEFLREAQKPEPRRELIPGYWCEGQLAVLAGLPHTGRSIFATQIAETIARGLTMIPHSTLRTPNLRTLTLELRHTIDDFTRRYTGLSPNGRLIRYLFHKNNQRTFVGSSAAMLRDFGYSRERMYHEALARVLNRTEHSIIIVDDLTALCGVRATANDIREMLRRFRRWIGGTNRAVLILAELAPNDIRPANPSSPRNSKCDAHNSKPETRYSKLFSSLLAESDSLFTLNHSTMSPQIRYLKLIHQVNDAEDHGPTPLPPEDRWHRLGDGVVGAEGGVAGRPAWFSTPPPNTVDRPVNDSPPYEGGVAGRPGWFSTRLPSNKENRMLLPEVGAEGAVDAASADGVVLLPASKPSSLTLEPSSSPFPIHDSRFTRDQVATFRFTRTKGYGAPNLNRVTAPNCQLPFLCLEYLGTTSELNHHRDYSTNPKRITRRS